MEYIKLFLTPLIITLLLMPVLIKQLKVRQFGQTVREDGPESHQKKNGTPTMGGVVIILSILLSSVFFLEMSDEITMVLLLFALGGLIGFIDDHLIVNSKENSGISGKQKLVGQILVSVIFVVMIGLSGISTELHIPFTDNSIDLGIFYYLFAIVLIIGTMNATNLTDGLDGLLGGTAFITFSSILIISHLLAETEILSLSVIASGALLGFLVFNINPAKIFMGDVGSLSIGGLIAGLFIILKLELLLLIIGAVFVIETLSVIIQVVYFKTTQKRVFRMTPLHHHFEEKGMSEVNVVRRFWVAGVVASVFGVAIIYYGFSFVV